MKRSKERIQDIDDIQTVRDSRGGKLSWFSMTTPFGDTTFRFAQRDGYRPLFPGMIFHEKPTGGQNRFRFNRIFFHIQNFGFNFCFFYFFGFYNFFSHCILV